MGCVNPDGTLTHTARKVLETIKDEARDDKSIAELTGIPMFKVRSSLREMFSVGFLGEVEKDQFKITPIGEKVLKG